MNAPYAIGYDFLVSRARENGYNNGPDEFDVLCEAPPAPVEIVALGTEGEICHAASVGSPHGIVRIAE